VIYAAGAITGGRSGFDPLNGAVVGSDTLIEYIRQARRDSSVRAIVLRIDSPGGSATASDAIWRELTIAKNERADRPLVASMSDLAASGGYYIAMPAQVIVALPQGRVWTGRQAKQNHLVDELGGLDRAIAIAKQRAKIPSENDVELVIYPPRKSFYELVSDQFSGSSESATVGAWLNANLSRGELEVLRTMRAPLALFRRGEPLALMPV